MAEGKRYYYEPTKYPGILRYVGAEEESYVIDFYANGKRHREKVEGGLTKAREELEKRRKAGRFGSFVPQNNMKRFCIEDLLKKYQEEKAGNEYFEKTETHYLEIIENYFKGRKLLSITPWDILQLYRDRSKILKKDGKPRSNASINREVALLRHILNSAVFYEMLEINPFDKFQREQNRAQKRVFLEQPKRDRVLKAENLIRSSPTAARICETSLWGFFLPI